MKLRKIKARHWVRVVLEHQPPISLMQCARLYKRGRLVGIIQRYFSAAEHECAIRRNAAGFFSHRQRGKSWLHLRRLGAMQVELPSTGKLIVQTWGAPRR